MIGFKDFQCAHVLLGGIEVMHMVVKGQMNTNGKGASICQFFCVVL